MVFLRKKVFNSPIFCAAVFLLVLYATFVLRAHNYDRTPLNGHLEEMAYAWAGIYLIETGTPVSWSTLDYPKSAEVYKGKITTKGGEPSSFVTLYKPWLDEPPLFSAVVGWFAHIYHADRTGMIPASYIRMPVVIFATLASIMIFLVARLVSGYWIGILAMLLYGTIPIMVFASRMAVPENLIALILIIVVYLLIKFEKGAKFLYLLPIPLLVGIAGLAKATGFFLIPLAIYFAYSKKSYKSCLYLALGVLPFIAAFYWFGLHFDPEIFWRITAIQGMRPAGFSSLGWFLTSPAYDVNMLVDSWYIFALMVAVYFIFSPKTGIQRVISLSFVYWIIIVMISGGEQDLLPWYRFPAFPLLAILGAWGLQVLVEKANFFTTFLAAGMLLGNRYLLVNAFRPNISPMNYRLIFSALMLPSLINLIHEKKWLKKLSRIVILAVIVVGMYFNIIYIYNRFELECESLSCPIGPSTKLSTVHFPLIWKLMVLGDSATK